MGVRRADFAGSWYPGRASECREMIQEFLGDTDPCPGGAEQSVGGIVPHAGWVFSGRIACRVIACLSRTAQADTCLIFGRHMYPENPNIMMKEGLWDTPLGELEIDEPLAGALAAEFAFELETPSRYEPDNTIEVQLPFVKHFFPQTRIVPLGLPPRAESLVIARRAVDLARSLDRQIVVLGSTDMTHYGYNYGFMPRGSGPEAVTWVREINDKRAVDLMATMEAEALIREALENRNACCAGAAASAMEAARALGAARGILSAYATSYDVRPDSSFVGYAGVVFSV